MTRDIFFQLQKKKTKPTGSACKNDLRTYDNIQEIETVQGDDILISNYTYLKKTLQDDSNRFKETTRT